MTDGSLTTMSDTSNLTRRTTLKGLGLVTAAVSAPAVLSAAEPEQTPLERIEHLLEELRIAMGEHYSGAGIQATFNELTPEHVEEGSVACVMVIASTNL